MHYSVHLAWNITPRFVGTECSISFDIEGCPLEHKCVIVMLWIGLVLPTGAQVLFHLFHCPPFEYVNMRPECKFQLICVWLFFLPCFVMLMMCA